MVKPTFAELDQHLDLSDAVSCFLSRAIAGLLRGIPDLGYEGACP